MNFASLVRFVRALIVVSATSILSTPFTGVAQPGPTQPPPPARLRFLFLDESPGYYALKTDERSYRQVSASPYEISAPYIPGSLAPMEIYKTSRTPDPATGQPRRIKIATFSPPNNTPSALVVVTPRPPAAPDAPLDFKVEVIDCNPAEFPGGSIRIVNRGRGGMAAQFGTTRVVTQPGETKVVRPTVDTRNRMLSKVAAEEATGWKVLSSTFTILRPTERVFGIFIYSPGGLRHTRTAQEIAEFGPPAPGHFWLTFSDSI